MAEFQSSREPVPFDFSYIGDCESTTTKLGFIAACVLDEGHPGPHVAADGLNIVEVWD